MPTSTDILDFIKSRRSIGNLTAPAPTRKQVEQAIEVAMSAPDHKSLNPYRFVILEDNALKQFGEALKTAAIAQGQTDEMSLSKTENLPLRAPMIVACVTRYQDHEKVPHWEQLAACAASVQNLLLAFDAQGFATVWRTGLLANEPAVKAFFGVDDINQVVGFVYVGTYQGDVPERAVILVDDFVEFRQ